MRGMSSRDAALHRREPVPPAQRQRPHEPTRLREVEGAVDGHRVVDRRHDRPALLVHAEQSRSEALVVVDDVEVASPAGERGTRPPREGARFAETPGPHRRELHGVGRRGDLAQARPTERVRLPVQVEARQRREVHAFVEFRVRLAGEHGDAMARRGERPREVPRVDPLSAAARVAAVDEERDAQRAVGGSRSIGGTSLPRREASSDKPRRFAAIPANSPASALADAKLDGLHCEEPDGDREVAPHRDHRDPAPPRQDGSRRAA